MGSYQTCCPSAFFTGRSTCKSSHNVCTGNDLTEPEECPRGFQEDQLVCWENGWSCYESSDSLIIIVARRFGGEKKSYPPVENSTA